MGSRGARPSNDGSAYDAGGDTFCARAANLEVARSSAVRQAPDGLRPTWGHARRSRSIESAVWSATMNALAYLLGARALDLARDGGSSPRPIPEPGSAPIASTEETAAAWRRWAQAGDPFVALASLDVGRPATATAPAPAQP